jgi:hypothetical protein
LATVLNLVRGEQRPPVADVFVDLGHDRAAIRPLHVRTVQSRHGPDELVALHTRLTELVEQFVDHAGGGDRSRQIRDRVVDLP